MMQVSSHCSDNFLVAGRCRFNLNIYCQSQPNVTPFALLGKAICEEQQQKVEALQADAAQAGIQKELGFGNAFT